MSTKPERRLRPSYIVIAFAAALVLGATTMQVVSARNDRTINGCVSKKTGLLRIVSDPGGCKAKNRAPISFNQTGPPGPTGPQGSQGPQGQPPAFAFDEAPGAFSTDSPSYIKAPDGDGPAVTVDVPASGFIEVGASALMSEDPGAVSLFDVATNAPVPGQSDVCDEISNAPPGEGLLFTSPGGGIDGTFSTPAVPNLLDFCANTGGPGTVLLGPLTPAGPHTLELRYAECGCGSSDPATFDDRRLWARPAP